MDLFIFSWLLVSCSICTVNGVHRGPTNNKMWEFEVDLPKVLQTLRSYTGVSISGSPTQDQPQSPIARYGQPPDILSQKLKFEISSPGLAQVMNYVKSLVNVDRRSEYSYPPKNGEVFVDIGQSAKKIPKYTYPPNHDWYRFTSLYKIAQEEKEKKQLHLQ